MPRINRNPETIPINQREHYTSGGNKKRKILYGITGALAVIAVVLWIITFSFTAPILTPILAGLAVTITLVAALFILASIIVKCFSNSKLVILKGADDNPNEEKFPALTTPSSTATIFNGISNSTQIPVERENFLLAYDNLQDIIEEHILPIAEQIITGNKLLSGQKLTLNELFEENGKYDKFVYNKIPRSEQDFLIYIKNISDAVNKLLTSIATGGDTRAAAVNVLKAIMKSDIQAQELLAKYIAGDQEQFLQDKLNRCQNCIDQCKKLLSNKTNNLLDNVSSSSGKGKEKDNVKDNDEDSDVDIDTLDVFK